MAKTYEPIATTTVNGTSTGSVTFSSIPGTYTDLRLVFGGSWIASFGYAVFWLRLNGDTGTNYSSTYIQAYGSGYLSSRESNQSNMYLNYSQDSGNASSMTTMDIMNYSNSTTNKTVLAKGSQGDYSVTPSVGLWRSTSAITSVEIRLADNVKFSSGSVVTLYGIKAA
jgi:hypothetical protein